MRALVTGCAGFIGSHITDRLLKEGYEVIGIDCFTDYYPRALKESNIVDARSNPRFSFLEKNLLDMNSYPSVDYVFHQAAQAGVRASWGTNFEIYCKNNIIATQKLLEWYKNHKVKKIVYASSSSVYGDTNLPMHEEMKLQPISPYGVSKLAAEHLCYLYSKNFGVPIISLRYFTVYGPRQRPDMGIYKFVNSIAKGIPLTIYGTGNQTRDFTYISDIVEANILAANSPIIGKVFNIGGGNQISVNDLISIIEGISNKRAIIRKSENQSGDVKDTLANIQLANFEMGWKPKIDIKNGIKKYCEWFLINSATAD